MEGHSTRVYRGSGRSLGTCGAGLHCICTARATVHRWAARAGLLGVPSQAPHICEVVQSSEEKGAGVRSQ